MDGFKVLTGAIPANQIDMCKFPHKDDIGYKRILGFLQSLLDDTESQNLSSQ